MNRSPAGASTPDDIGRRFAAMQREIDQLRTARTAEATSISEGTFSVTNGANLEITGGGQFVSRYANGQAAVRIGPAPSTVGGLHGTGLYVRGEQNQQIFWATHASDGRTEIVMGVNDSRVGRIWAKAEDVDVDASGEVVIYTNGGPAAFGGNSGTYLRPESTGDAANVHMAADGRVFRSTSSRRYKTDILDAQFDPDAVLRLQPRTWLPGPIPKTCPGWLHQRHTDRSHCPAEQEPACPDPDARRQVGFVAEELVDLGLEDFVEFNAEGEPEAIYYDRLTAALVPVLQRQQAQIDDLTEKLEQLTTRVAGHAHAPEPNTRRQ